MHAWHIAAITIPEHICYLVVTLTPTLGLCPPRLQSSPMGSLYTLPPSLLKTNSLNSPGVISPPEHRTLLPSLRMQPLTYSPYLPIIILSKALAQMILTVFLYPKPELSRSTWDCSTRVQILHPISNPLGQALECAKWKDSMTESWKICPCDPLSLYPAPLAHEGIHFKKEKKNKNQAVGQFQDLLR